MKGQAELGSIHAPGVTCGSSFSLYLVSWLFGRETVQKAKLRGPGNEVVSCCCFYFKEQKNQQTRN